jgi:bacteriocin-like protein
MESLRELTDTELAEVNGGATGTVAGTTATAINITGVLTLAALGPISVTLGPGGATVAGTGDYAINVPGSFAAVKVGALQLSAPA